MLAYLWLFAHKYFFSSLLLYLWKTHKYRFFPGGNTPNTKAVKLLCTFSHFSKQILSSWTFNDATHTHVRMISCCKFRLTILTCVFPFCIWLFSICIRSSSSKYRVRAVCRYVFFLGCFRATSEDSSSSVRRHCRRVYKTRLQVRTQWFTPVAQTIINTLTYILPITVRVGVC